MLKKLKFALLSSLAVAAVSGCSVFGPSDTFTTVKVGDENIKLANTVEVIDGHKSSCKQYVKRMEMNEGTGYTVTIGKHCVRM